jgi:hypothetical protein
LPIKSHSTCTSRKRRLSPQARPSATTFPPAERYGQPLGSRARRRTVLHTCWRSAGGVPFNGKRLTLRRKDSHLAAEVEGSSQGAASSARCQGKWRGERSVQLSRSSALPWSPPQIHVLNAHKVQMWRRESDSASVLDDVTRPVDARVVPNGPESLCHATRRVELAAFQGPAEAQVIIDDPACHRILTANGQNGAVIALPMVCDSLKEPIGLSESASGQKYRTRVN